MMILFNGDKLITNYGKEIIFDRLEKIDGKTIGIYDNTNTFYLLSEFQEAVSPLSSYVLDEDKIQDIERQEQDYRNSNREEE